MSIYLALLISFCLNTDWVMNDLPQAGFRIESPALLTHDSTVIETDLGSVDYHTFHCALEEDDASFVFLVQYYQHASLEVYRDSVQMRTDFFDATVEQAALAIGGQVMIEDDFTFKNKYPGRFWRIHYNGGDSVMKTQAFLVGDHFYMVQVAVDAPHSLSDKIDRFFDTFRLIS